MLPKILASSVNSNKLALTVKGILTGIIPLFLFIATSNGVDLAQGELSNIVEAISSVIVSVGGVVSAIMTFVGLVRKLAVKFE